VTEIAFKNNVFRIDSGFQAMGGDEVTHNRAIGSPGERYTIHGMRDTMEINHGTLQGA
jgi:hypothetical protein